MPPQTEDLPRFQAERRIEMLLENGGLLSLPKTPSTQAMTGARTVPVMADALHAPVELAGAFSNQQGRSFREGQPRPMPGRSALQ